MEQGDAPSGGDYFVDTQVARMLGVNPVTVRQWRVKNKKLGERRYGPPYEYRGTDVVYPKGKFREWCAGVQVIGGIPHANLPLTANQAEIQQATAKHEQDVFGELNSLGRTA